MSKHRLRPAPPFLRPDRLRWHLRRALTGPHSLAFLPACVLAAFWIGGEPWLILIALALPLSYALAGGFQSRPDAPPPELDEATGLPPREVLEDALDDRLDMARTRGRHTACLMVEIDDFAEMADRLGRAAADDILCRTAERLRGAVRGGDLVCKCSDGGFGIALAPVAHLDVEIAIQLAARLQAVVEEPLSIGASVTYASCSVGFCMGSRAPDRSGRGLVRATAAALDEARRNAPSAIRSYSAEMARRERTAELQSDEVERALVEGHILPFFQPQLSTDTGKVTGFEALARWCHPERGVIQPADFLPVLERAGLLERLGEIMLTRSLAAMAEWDRAGLDIPQVGVNFASDELQDPKLLDKVRWQLDRFDLAPRRLTVEVLETVVAASPADIVARNVNGLAALGCRVDLDDFGTGHASISSIRRFAVERIKIDRSFVMKVDRDAEQQKMVSAILTMAERLGLETLAEGVETRGEHAMLAQLGCTHVQGFGIARPMPFEQTADWVRAHEAGLTEGLAIGRGATG